MYEVKAEDVLQQQGVPGEGVEGRAQAGVREAAGGRRGRGRDWGGGVAGGLAGLGARADRQAEVSS